MLKTLLSIALILGWIAPAVGQTLEGAPVKRVDRRVYVPIDELDAVVAGDASGVLMPFSEYQKLVQAASPNSPQDAQNLIPISASYSGRFEENQLIVTAALKFRQARNELTAWKLPFRNVAIEKGLLNDQPTHLARGPAPERELILFHDQAGTHTLRLQLVVQGGTVAGDQVAIWSFPALPLAVFSLELPAGKNLTWDDASVDRPAAIDQPAVFELPIGGKNQMALRVSERRIDRTEPSMVFASSAIGLHVAAEEQTWRAISQINVFGSPIDSLNLEVPNGLEIVSVDSSGLDRWEIVKTDQSQTLRLNWRQSFSDQRTVVLQGVNESVQGQPWSVPRLQIPGIAAHQVGVLVQAHAGLRLKSVEATGVRRIAAAEASQAGGPMRPDMTIQVAESQQWHYAAWRDDFTLLFQTQPRGRELWLTIASQLSVAVPELRLESEIQASPRHGPLFELDVSLPAEWGVQEIRVANQPARWKLLASEPGTNQYRVMFEPAIGSGQSVTVSVSAVSTPDENFPPEENPVEFAIPLLQVAEATAALGRYEVVTTPDLYLQPQNIVGLDPIRLSPSENQQAGETGARLVWEHPELNYSGQIQVSRRDTRILAKTQAFHRLGKDSLSSTIEMLLTVSGGGVRRQQIALPDSIPENLLFRVIDFVAHNGSSDVSISEQSSAPGGPGERIWTLTFSQRISGAIVLGVSIQREKNRDETEIELPRVRVVGAMQQAGQIAIEAYPDQQLDVTARDASGRALREVDASDLSRPIEYEPSVRVALAYETIRPGESIVLKETRYSPGTVPTAICESLAMTSVVDASGEVQHRAHYTFRAVGVQSLLVQPPGEAELWATMIDGTPIEVRRAIGAAGEAAVYHVPLPAIEPPDTRRTLRFYYRTQRGLSDGVRSLYEVPPRLMVLTGQGDRLPIDILEREWTLHYPQEGRVVRSQGDFLTQKPLNRQSALITLTQNFLTVPSSSIAVRTGFLVLMTLLGIAIMRFGQSTLRTKLLIVGGSLLTGFAMVVIGIMFLISSGKDGGREFAPTSDSIAQQADLSESHRSMRESYQKMKPMEQSVPSPQFSAGSGRGIDMDSVLSDSESKSSENRPSDMPLDTAKAEQPQKDSLPTEVDTRMRTPVSATASGGKLDALEMPAPAAPVAGGMPMQPPLLGAQFGGQQEGQPGGQGIGGQQGQAGGGDIAAKPVAKDKSIRGRLSLPIDLQVPPNYRSVELVFSGVPAGTSEPTLEVDLANDKSDQSHQLVWGLGIAVVFWLVRKKSWRVRICLGIPMICIPWSLVTIMRIDLLPILDGVFFGACLGWCLWILYAIKNQAQISWEQLSQRLGLAAVGLIAALITQNGNAQETAPGVPVVIPDGVIVVPYDPNDKLPTEILKPTDKVFIPWQQFQGLRPSRAQRVEPTARIGLVEARVQIQIPPKDNAKSASARVSAVLQYVSRESTQQRVPLPFKGIVPRRAVLNGKAAPLVSRLTDEAGATQNAAPGVGETLELILDRAGVYELELEFDLPCEATSQSGQVVVPITEIPSGMIELTLPDKSSGLVVTGGARGFRRVVQGEVAKAVAPIENAGDVTLIWGPQQNREVQQAVIYADSTNALVISDVGLKYASETRMTVRQGTVAQATLNVPNGWLVRQVAGNEVAGWESGPANGASTLEIRFRKSISDQATFTIDLFRPVSIGEMSEIVAFPDVSFQGAASETGIVGVFPGNQFAVAAVATTGATQVEQNLFPANDTAVARALLGPSDQRPQRVYRFVRRPVELSFLASRQKPESRGVAEHTVQIEQRRQRILSRFHFDLAGAPRSEVAFQLPEGCLVSDVASSIPADSWVEGSADGVANILHVELSTPRVGALVVEVAAIVPRLPDDPVAIVTMPLPLDFGDLRSTVGLWVDPAFTAKVEASNGWKAIDPESARATLPGSARSAARFAYSTANTGVQPLALVLSPADVRLNAVGLSQLFIHDTAVEYTVFLRWSIETSSTRRVAFQVPEWFATQMDVATPTPGVQIRQKTKEPLAGNRQRIIVDLEEPRARELVLVATATSSLPESGRVEIPLVTFDQPIEIDGVRQIRPLESQRSYALLVNLGYQRVQGQGLESLEAVTANDLPLAIPEELRRQATGLWRVKDPKADVAWQLEAAETIKGLAAAVNYAGLTQVLTQDGSWRTTAEYRVVNRARQFLPIRIPTGSRILSVHVGNRADRPINPGRANDPDVVLIPLPRTATGDLSSVIRVVLQGRLPKALPRGVQIGSTELDLPAPQVLSPDEDPQHGIPVSATEWNVYLPDGQTVWRIDDPDRTNVAQTAAGLNQGIAAFQEWLELYRQLEDPKLDRSARSRSLNNLKKLDADLGRFYAEGMKASSPENPRAAEQQKEIRDLKQQVDRAQRELDVKKSQVDGLSRFDNKRAQSELIQFNTKAIVEDSDKSIESEFVVTPQRQADGAATERSKNNSRSQLSEQLKAQSGKFAEQQMKAMDESNAPSQENGQFRTSADGEGDFTRNNLAPAKKNPSNGEPPGASQNLGDMPLSGESGATNFRRSKSSGKSRSERGEQRQKGDAKPGGMPDMGGMGMGGMGPGGGAGGGVPGVGGPGGPGGVGPGADALFADGVVPLNGAKAGDWDVAGRDPFAAGNDGTSGASHDPTGLSLQFEVPKAARHLTFSKSGGNPRLAVGLRPHDSYLAVDGIVWLIAWQMVGIATLVLVFRESTRGWCLRKLGLLIALSGATLFIFSPMPWLGFFLLVGGAVTSWRRGELKRQQADVR